MAFTRDFDFETGWDIYIIFITFNRIAFLIAYFHIRTYFTRSFPANRWFPCGSGFCQMKFCESAGADASTAANAMTTKALLFSEFADEFMI